MPIPEYQKAQLSLLTQEITRLEAEETRLDLQAREILMPLLLTPQDCEDALDLVPPGYLSFCIRRRQAELQEQNTHEPD